VTVRSGGEWQNEKMQRKENGVAQAAESLASASAERKLKRRLAATSKYQYQIKTLS